MMEKLDSEYHIPVMLIPSIDALIGDVNGVYVDTTYGGGSHSREILSRLGPSGKLYAFDQDQDALANSIEDERFMLIDSNFRKIKAYLRSEGIKAIDGMLADLGVSSHQFDEGSRGFSIRYDGPLDMRMDAREGLPAFDLLKKMDQESLQKILSEYGEVRNAKTLSFAIVDGFKKGSIISTGDLVKVLEDNCMGQRHKYLAQVFQAIRIAVNDEMGSLKDLLVQTSEILKPNGKMVVLSYHSLEDRLVKNFFKTGNFEGKPEKDFYGNLLRSLKPIGSKPIEASDEEKRINSRSRSAKMRVAEKV
jgi:16S rRNA (cytosine1402-N4)-methyltransferase